MRVLIAGGTGFIGRRLTEAAMKRGWEVHLLLREPASEIAGDLNSRGVHITPGDITDPSSLDRAFARVRPAYYFHNAGWYELGISIGQRDRMWNVNVDGLANALAAAEANAVEKVVVTSSTTALGDTGGAIVDEAFVRQSAAMSWYEHTMSEAQKLALNRIAAGMPIVLASPAQVIGPGDHSVFGIMLRLFLRRLLPPTLWAPEGSFSFVHVEDVANGLVCAMESGRVGENYFLSGSIMTNREMLQLWNAHTGRSLPIVWMPRGLALLTGYLAAPTLRLIGQPAFISPEVVRSSYVSFRYSDEKARRELGLSIRSAKEAWGDTIDEQMG